MRESTIPSERRTMTERTCIGCGNKAQKTELLRFVCREDGYLSFDLKQREPGRGGYLCARGECFTLAAKRRRLSVRFHRDVKEDASSILKTFREGMKREGFQENRFPTMTEENETAKINKRSATTHEPFMHALQLYSKIFSGGSSEWPK
jgi:uncharacterized protein